jgi:acetylornithine/succinyldiaminopimelate/putrescine aminotransferase
VCDAVNDELMAHVRATGALLADGMRELPGVVDVRGRGLLLAGELDREVAPVVTDCLEAGLVVLSAGDRVLRLTPPLVVGPDEVGQALTTLKEVLA